MTLEESSSVYVPGEGDLKYIDHLQKKNAEDLAFYPLSALLDGINRRRIIACSENDEMAGYLWHGAVREGKDVIIFQACVDYTARRRHLGFGMVRNLLAIAKAGNCTGIRLKCASSSESNEFWQLIGFYCTEIVPGGMKRKRNLNVYRTDIVEPETPYPRVVPSDKPSDTRAYYRGESGLYVSRFSRAHYGQATENKGDS